VPYQLHCEVDAQADEVLELATELLELLEEVVTTELFDELEVEVTTELELLLVTTPEQTAPVMVGVSAAPPFKSPWTPKLTDWPGWMVLFQSSAVAE